MMYNNYKIMMIHKGDKNFYSTECIGTTVAEAIEHYDFWCAKGDRISEDFEILKAIVTSTTTDYPYEYEDLMKKAFASKTETIARLEKSRACARDKEDLKEIIENEDASKFWTLSTLCRDRFWEFMR